MPDCKSGIGLLNEKIGDETLSDVLDRALDHVSFTFFCLFLNCYIYFECSLVCESYFK